MTARLGDTEVARLDQSLLAAHAADDRAALVTLYEIAGHRADAAGDLDAACFYWTHARVFALELGDPRAETLRTRLVAEAREA